LIPLVFQPRPGDAAGKALRFEIARPKATSAAVDAATSRAPR